VETVKERLGYIEIAAGTKSMQSHGKRREDIELRSRLGGHVAVDVRVKTTDPSALRQNAELGQG
jgi:hypothetical protein